MEKYEEELKYKAQKVEDAFKRIGGLSPEFMPIISSPETTRYRNKAQYPVRRENGILNIGFYAKKSHRVIDGGDCLFQPEDSFRSFDDCQLAGAGNRDAQFRCTGRGIVCFRFRNLCHGFCVHNEVMQVFQIQFCSCFSM